MDSKQQKIEIIAKHNGLAYNKLKAIEELGELTAALAQSVTKSDDNNGHILEEIGDVIYRLKVLRTHYDNKAIKKRVKKKLDKSLVYLKTGRFKRV